MITYRWYLYSWNNDTIFTKAVYLETHSEIFVRKHTGGETDSYSEKWMEVFLVVILDSPSSTSAVTYLVRVQGNIIHVRFNADSG